MSAVDDSGEGVAAGSGEQDEPQTYARTELVAHCPDQDGARGRVADHVRRIAMKCERGDGSPPLPSDDALGISTPALEPSAAACGPRSGDGKKPDQHEADGETDPGGAANRFHRGAVGSRRLRAVLPVVGVE